MEVGGREHVEPVRNGVVHKDGVEGMGSLCQASVGGRTLDHMQWEVAGTVLGPASDSGWRSGRLEMSPYHRAASETLLFSK